jgi:PGF-pre-PGF domain-containing protein
MEKKGFEEIIFVLIIIASLVSVLALNYQSNLIEGDRISYPSIAVDSSDTVHMAFFNETSHLVYCNNSGGTWNCEEIETSGSSSSGFCSLAIDSNDKVHISYSNRSAGLDNGRYCNNSNGWVCGNIELSESNYNSLAIDINDIVHLVYFNITDGDLRYCNNSLGTWNCENIEEVETMGYYPSLAIDSSNTLHISHQNNTGKDLRYCNNSGGTWNCENVETSGLVGYWTKIAVDSKDGVHMTSYDLTNQMLRYCNNSGGTWNCENIGSGGSNFGYSSLMLDASDKVHLVYYDNTGNDLNYCENTFGTWSCSILGEDVGKLANPMRLLAIKKGRLADSTSFSNRVHVAWAKGDGNVSYYNITAPLLIDYSASTTFAGNLSQNYIRMNISANFTLNDIQNMTVYFHNATAVVFTNISYGDSYYINYTGLSDGTYYINASVNNSDGDINYSLTRKIVLDTTSPTLSLSSSSATRNSLVINTGAVDATSGLSSCDSDIPTATTTISTITETGLDCGTEYTYRLNCLDYAGNSVTSAPTSFSTSSCIGGSAINTGSNEVTEENLIVPVGLVEVKHFDEITPEEPVEMEFFKDKDSVRLWIQVNRKIYDVSFRAQKIKKIDFLKIKKNYGETFQSFWINKTGLEDEDIEKAILEFGVNKTSIDLLNGELEEMRLFKKQSGKPWETFDAKFIREDGDYNYFTSTFDSLSIFATAIDFVRCNNNNVCEPNLSEDLENCPNDCFTIAEEKKFSGIIFIVLFVGLILITGVILGIVFIKKKGKSKKSKK